MQPVNEKKIYITHILLLILYPRVCKLKFIRVRETESRTGLPTPTVPYPRLSPLFGREAKQ